MHVLGLGPFAKAKTAQRASASAPKPPVITEAEIETALAARKEARAAKDFARSDAIRDDLIAKGVEVMDGDPLGWDWKIGGLVHHLSRLRVEGSGETPIGCCTPNTGQALPFGPIPQRDL